jgi:hypothetical protein
LFYNALTLSQQTDCSQSRYKHKSNSTKSNIAMAAFITTFYYGLMLASSKVVALPQNLPPNTTIAGSITQEWTGTIIPSKPEYTLHGTVDGIYRQIMSIKENSGSNTIHDTDLWQKQKFEQRDQPEDFGVFNVRTIAGKKPPPPPVWQKYSDTLYCNVMGTGDVRDLTHQQDYLLHHKGQCGAPAKSCRRLACHNTSGVYICNDDDKDLSIPCHELAQLSNYISNQCCEGGFSNVDVFRQPNAGQLKLATVEGLWFQFIQGYANCNHDPTVNPMEYPLGGVNGDCPVREYSPGQPDKF